MTRVELFGKNAVPAGAHGIGRARQAAHQRAIGQTSQGPGLDGRGADVGKRYLPEQFAKAIDLFIQQAGDRLGRAVTAGEAGTAGDQHHLHLVVGNPSRNLSANLVQVILEQHPRGQLVTSLGETVDEHLARGVGFESAGIADREHGNVQRHERGICLGFHGGSSAGKEEDGACYITARTAPNARLVLGQCQPAVTMLHWLRNLRGHTAS
ncbi:hypothetical protein PS623_04745 [Pseudomonas fluorescens]|nr:hypothetical protein PS623_04745 [Pseudomonas fluorescens]